MARPCISAALFIQMIRLQEKYDIDIQFYQFIDLVLYQIVPSHRCCYVPDHAVEYRYSNYQILINPENVALNWVAAPNGQMPPGALQGGMESNGDKLYIGRAHYNGSLVVGKVHQGLRNLYIAFAGKEVTLTSFEVLVSQTIGL